MYKLLFAFLSTTISLAQPIIPALIPSPQTLEPRTGRFAITAQTRLNVLTPVPTACRSSPTATANPLAESWT